MVSGTFTSTVQVESVDKRKACPKTSKAEGTANPIRADVGLFSTFQLLSSACAELLWWLGVPGQWLLNFLYLVMFVIVMLPAFIPVFLHYLLSSTVVKNITYGPSIRHQLDIYLPKNCSPNKSKAERGLPVVIFFSGGAWIIGYKTWAFMMGKVMQANGIIFVAPDYRNFPQAVAKEMVDDVMLSVQWVFDNIQNEGGDISRISLVGQSAGAHLTSLAIMYVYELICNLNRMIIKIDGPHLPAVRPHSAKHKPTRTTENAGSAHSWSGGSAYLGLTIL
jgi:prenylcysteine alpha-carboxyl methylesterase